MRKIILIITISLYFTVCGYNQQLTPIEFNTAGNEIKNNNFILTYTIGGTFSNSLNNNDKILTQGFQQSVSFSPAWINDNFYTKIEISAFPNPSMNEVNILIKNLPYPVLCYFEIYNLSGEKIFIPGKFYKMFNGQEITLDLRSLASGCYLVHLINKEDYMHIAYFKLIKLK